MGDMIGPYCDRCTGDEGGELQRATVGRSCGVAAHFRSSSEAPAELPFGSATTGIAVT